MKIKKPLLLLTVSLLLFPFPSISNSTEDDTKKTDEKVMSFFDKIKEGVEKNDFAWIAKQFSYPMCIDIDCRWKEIKNAEELLKYKNNVFTENIRKAVLDQKCDELFSKNGGYMIGSGEIWFDLVTGIWGVTNNAGYSVSKCGSTKDGVLDKKYFGAWKIYRTESVGGSMSAEIIGAAIGKKIYIKKNSFISEAETLWKSLKNVEWLTEETSEDDSSKGSLIWYGLPDALPNITKMIYACSGGQEHLYFEITKKDELACYLDGYFIFMKKIR